ncbi:sialate O-acetylesterase [Pogona vitticeps]
MMMAACPGLLLLLFLPAWSAGAKLSFASYYADHMVLQKEPSQAVLWGYGKPGANIFVTLRQRRSQEHVMKKVTMVQDTTIWKVLLLAMHPGGPYTIEVQQSNKKKMSNVTLKDVYFGDVWLCSGQSNMEMTVSQIFNASEELAAASQYPLVRVFAPALVESETELEDLAGINLQWSIPTAKNLGHGDFTYFSAVCWLFGRYLYEKLRYPIGLIDSSWGGTPIEAWSSKRALAKCAVPPGDTKRFPVSDHNGGPKDYSVLWNAMIHPLLNMTLQGAIWYQGEQNTLMNTDLYNCTFPALIRDWRRAFHKGSGGQTPSDFPFGFVQLCTDRRAVTDDHFPRIRWHQTADYGYVPNEKMPNTFMAVTIDLGDHNSPYGSIHPRDKQTVAYRLHLGALAVAYGEKSMIFQGPYPQKVQVNVVKKYINVTYGERVHLHHLDNKIFEVCCSEQPLCKWSPVPIKSSSSSSVMLQNPVCPDAVAGLRYAWGDWPCEYKQCPIYNLHDLPGPPFITFARNNPGWTVS